MNNKTDKADLHQCISQGISFPVSIYICLSSGIGILWHTPHTWAHLETANGHVHLTAAFIRTVEHLQHAVCLDYGTPPTPLGPDTQTHTTEMTSNHISKTSWTQIRLTASIHFIEHDIMTVSNASFSLRFGLPSTPWQKLIENWAFWRRSRKRIDLKTPYSWNCENGSIWKQ